jgi:hypothetical protein
LSPHMRRQAIEEDIAEKLIADLKLTPFTPDP